MFKEAQKIKSSQGVTMSYEVPPPKRGDAESIDRLLTTQPPFISVTHHIPDSEASTLGLVTNHPDTIFMPHITSVGRTPDELAMVVEEYYKIGVRRFLALRGDLTPEYPNAMHAGQIVRIMREMYGNEIVIGVAAHLGPNGHPDSKDPEKDMDYLADKLDNDGADLAISQCVEDLSDCVRLIEGMKRRGCTKEIIFSVILPRSSAVLRRIAILNGTPIPQEMVNKIEKIETSLNMERKDMSKEERIKISHEIGEVAIVHAAQMVRGIVNLGAQDVHVCTMGRSETAVKLHDCLKSEGAHFL